MFLRFVSTLLAISWLCLAVRADEPKSSVGTTGSSLAKSTAACGVAPTESEMAEARRWVAATFEAPRGTKTGRPFFSFTYDGRSSTELLGNWESTRTTRSVDGWRIERVIRYRDPTTGLVVRCVGIEYRDFPTVEWTLYFQNAGDKATPILADIQALDIQIKRQPGPSSEPTEFHLHHCSGSHNNPRPDDYQPFDTTLGPGVEKRFSGDRGLSTGADLPNFNLEISSQEGLIIVVGWPGQWAARFTRDQGRGLQIRAGQELTHFKLLPGETVRTPLIVLQFWKGDRIRAQNTWRRWVMAHSMPRPGGKLPPPLLAACSSRVYEEMVHADEQNQIMHIDRYLAEGLKPDYWWMDAGWYAVKKNWGEVGTWEVDRRRFPRGLRFISDYAHTKGIGTIVWFEPERAKPGSWLAKRHPEWLLGKGEDRLLNIGDPDAWNWLTTHVDRMIAEQGIDVYRHDANIEPLAYWRANDAEDRQGITEIKYVTGLLSYWDELQRRHPKLLIDSCASGGRRNDLETVRRAIMLTRSDFVRDPAGSHKQNHTYGLSFWLPYHGSSTVACRGITDYYGSGKTPVEPYAFWTDSAPGLLCMFDVREKGLGYASLRRLVEQRREIAPCWFGDYYPLTPYSLAEDAWMAWQFNCPESGQGMVQAFRRSKSPHQSICLKLHGLRTDARYRLTRFDRPGTTELSGRELHEEGLTVVVEDKPGVGVIRYSMTAAGQPETPRTGSSNAKSRSIQSILTEVGEVPRPEHPRPDRIREHWQNLNGVWEFAFDPRNVGVREGWSDGRQLAGRIVVPFCPESLLSGVMDEGPHPVCWYARTFDLPADLRGQRVLLHFGAVDYRAEVWLNGRPLGRHEGGYDPFAFDVGQILKPSGNRLTVRVDDDAREAKPYGKQSPDPKGCRYMRVTGIWQTVWLERVGKTFLRDWILRANPRTGQIDVSAQCDGPTAGLQIETRISRNGKKLVQETAPVTSSKVHTTSIVPNAQSWSPEKPVLYWCDRLGLLVWREMADWGLEDSRPDSPAIDSLLRQWQAGVLRDINHPCIITWVPTNEWQSPKDHRISRIKVRFYETTRSLDPTRPVVDNSGYCHTKTDVVDLHVNPPNGDACRKWWIEWSRSIAESGNFPVLPGSPAFADGFRYEGQPVVISETGNWRISELPPIGPWPPSGYGPIPTTEKYLDTYRDFFLALIAERACAGFCYVQLYDVEGEVNGYLTYDRRPKVPPEVIRAIHAEGLRRRAADP